MYMANRFWRSLQKKLPESANERFFPCILAFVIMAFPSKASFCNHFTLVGTLSVNTTNLRFEYFELHVVDSMARLINNFYLNPLTFFL